MDNLEYAIEIVRNKLNKVINDERYRYIDNVDNEYQKGILEGQANILEDLLLELELNKLSLRLNNALGKLKELYIKKYTHNAGNYIKCLNSLDIVINKCVEMYSDESDEDNEKFIEKLLEIYCNESELIKYIEQLVNCNYDYCHEDVQNFLNCINL